MILDPQSNVSVFFDNDFFDMEKKIRIDIVIAHKSHIMSF